MWFLKEVFCNKCIKQSFDVNYLNLVTWRDEASFALGVGVRSVHL